MSYHAKRRITNTAIYVTLALTVVAIICVTVVTFTAAQRKNDGGIPVEDDLPKEEDSPGTGSSSSDAEGSTSDKPNDSDSSAATSEPITSEDGSSEDADLPPQDENVSGDTDGDSGNLPTDGEELPFYVNPVKGYVLKEFSVELPIWSSTMEDYRTHNGIDISAAVGDAVVSIAAGLVKEIREDPLMGHTVVLEHDDGLVSIYQNLQPEDPEGIAPGVFVGAGQVIGAVGDSALSEVVESEHLHISLQKDGQTVNPLDYLDYTDAPKEDSGDE